MTQQQHQLPSGFTLRDNPPSDQSTHQLPEGYTLREPRSEQNFFERFGGDLVERFGTQGAEIVNSYVQSEQGFTSTSIQLAGKVGGGAVLDFIGEALVSGGRGLSNITPDMIEDPLVKNATKAGVFLLDTRAGKAGMEAAMKGANAWWEFKAENPVTARNIEAIVNIGLLIAPIKGKPKAGNTKLGNALAKPLERSAAKSTIQSKHTFLDELVRPFQSKKVRVQQVARTTETGIDKATGKALPGVGPFAAANRKKIVALSPEEQASSIQLRRVPGLGKKQTIQGNFNIIAANVSKKAKALEAQLRTLGTRGAYNAKEFERKIADNVLLKLKANPELVGDAAKSAERVIVKALKLADENPKTLAGLLHTRRQLDRWVLKHKPKAFEAGQASSAMTAATRAVRKEINDFIIVRAKGVKVRASLNAQSRMLRAMDDIAVKAQGEGNTMIARAFQTAIKVIPLRNEIVAAMGLIFGVGGLGAAALFIPFVQKVLIGAGIWYGTKGAIMNPATRQGIAKLIRVLDRGIRLSTDPVVIQRLRLDKAAMVELMKNSNTEESEEQN